MPEVLATEADLLTPVRLPVRRAGGESGAPSIQSLQLVPGNPARAVLRVSSVAGDRYRVERTASLGAGWSPAPATVEAPSEGDGVYVGTGGEVTCSVPCEHGETQMFFRIVRLP